MTNSIRSDFPTQLTIDAQGLSCPLPLLKAKQGLKALAPGESLKLLATDPGSVRDFETFAQLSGHRLLLSEQQNATYTYIIQKSV